MDLVGSAAKLVPSILKRRLATWLLGWLPGSGLCRRSPCAGTIASHGCTARPESTPRARRRTTISTLCRSMTTTGKRCLEHVFAEHKRVGVIGDPGAVPQDRSAGRVPPGLDLDHVTLDESLHKLPYDGEGRPEPTARGGTDERSHHVLSRSVWS